MTSKLPITNEMHQIDAHNQRMWELDQEENERHRKAGSSTRIERDQETITTLVVKNATSADKRILRDVLAPGLIWSSSLTPKNLRFEIVSLEALEAAYRLAQTRTLGDAKLSKRCDLRMSLPDQQVRSYKRKRKGKTAMVTGYSRRKKGDA